MGYGSVSSSDLSMRAAYRKASGTAFGHTAAMFGLRHDLRNIHESVDPKRKNGRGEQVRECLDSPDHSNTLPVVIGFDETGSMGEAPRILQGKLASLKGSLIRMGLEDAQLCFAAYGDAQNHEIAPCQVGQFESGIEMEDWLNNLYLEGNGGGNSGETSGLLLYFLANHVRLDSLTKRGKKGYLILTGDERPLPKITQEEIVAYIGDNAERDYTIAEVVAKATESFEIYFFMVDNAAAKIQDSYKVWSGLLGADHVVILESLSTISEQIALLIAHQESAIDSLDDGAAALVSEGASASDVASAARALVPIASMVSKSANAMVSGMLPAPRGNRGIRRV